MKGYKYIYLLKSEYDDKIDAIIYANKTSEVVDEAVQEAVDEYYELQLDYGQTMFILDYLCDKFDGDIYFEMGSFEEIYC